MTAILALVIAATLERCDTGTIYDMRMCWSRRDAAARDSLLNTYGSVVVEMRKRGINPQRLAAAQAAWIIARDKTCHFEYELYATGTIAPQLGVECDYRMTQARIHRLAALEAALQSGTALPPEAALSQTADRALNRLYRQYEDRITLQQRAALTAAELAWISYRDKACAIEKGTCLTDLENERVAELKAAWIGEPLSGPSF